MAGLYDYASIKNKPSRNGFDLSRSVKFTAKGGELLPCLNEETIPGDLWQIDLKSLTRTQPVVRPAYARCREYFDFFFVPYELLWRFSDNFFTQMENSPNHALSITQRVNVGSQHPYFTCKQLANFVHSHNNPSTSSHLNHFGFLRGELTCKLLEYLGYGDFTPFLKNTWTDTADSSSIADGALHMQNFQLSAFPLLAYQKIYCDYFRYTQWERSNPSTFNVDYLVGDSLQVPLDDISQFNGYTMLDMRYCNLVKDYFLGVLPNSQYGDEASVQVTDETGEPVTPGEFAQFGILALRQAQYLQKYKEIKQAGREDYRDQISRIFGITPPASLSGLSTYLGGCSSQIVFGDVVNTNIVEAAATLAGKGTDKNSTTLQWSNDGQFGVVMCLYHCIPIFDYTTGFVQKNCLKTHFSDYANPVFDKIGMELISVYELDNSAYGNGKSNYPNVIPLYTAGSSDQFLGYAPRYYDYKSAFDRAVGAFRTTEKPWVCALGKDELRKLFRQGAYSNYGNSQPDANSNAQPPKDGSGRITTWAFFKCNPSLFDNIFAVQADSSVSTDVLLVQAQFDIKVVRNLDVNGLPY